MPANHHYLSERARTTVLPLVVVGAVFASMVAILLVTVDHEHGTGPASETTTTLAPATIDDAIAAWVASARATVFPTYEGAYVGACPADASTTPGLCSMFREDLGTRRIYGVGASASDWGADVLVEREGAAGWAVIASAPWPNLGDNDAGWFGPPWSPHTAIRRWLSTDTSGTFPANAVYVGEAGSEAAIAGPDQTLLYGTLVSVSGETRVYAVFAQAEVVRLYLRTVEGLEHAWTVTATAPAVDRGMRIPAPW